MSESLPSVKLRRLDGDAKAGGSASIHRNIRDDHTRYETASLRLRLLQFRHYIEMSYVR
jgi:hypothetical protein